MKSTLHHSILTAALGLSAILPSTASATGPARQQRDPNEMVCERETVVGSRLAMRRTCLTRAQWAEQRHLERQAVERSQTQLCVAQGGACTAVQ
jgi:hypothetical protein